MEEGNAEATVQIEKENVETPIQIEKGNAATQTEEALKKFCCYLYVGNSRPVYKSKPWNDDDHYLQGEHMRNLEILAADKKTELVPIDKIKLAMCSNLVRRPETLMFALAMCARQKKSEKLRAAAYYFLAEHCKEWKYFILFIKYASYLCRVEGYKDKVEEKGDNKKPIGWGHGWKNAVNKWYLTKSPTDLVTLVVKHKGDHGWTHKDIFKLSHPGNCALEVEKHAILCYVMKGLEAAEKEFGDSSEAKRMLEHIRVTEEFKRCCNKHRVIELLGIHKFPIEYVHPTLQKDKDIWLTTLEQMDTRKILNNLLKWNQCGLMTKGGPATKTIVKSLVDPNNILWNEILPVEVLLVLNKYESPLTIPSRLAKAKTQSIKTGNRSTVVVNSQLKGKSKSFRPDKKVVETEEPDMRIRDALRSTFTISQTVNITDDAKRRYFVTIKIPPRFKESYCAEMGLALVFPLLKRADLPENAVRIIGYDRWMGGGLPLPITADTTFDEALTLFRRFKRDNNSIKAMPLGSVGFDYPEQYDVFINITNEPPQKNEHMVMKLYKEIYPETKFVNVMINKVPFTLKEDDWKDSLIINGFDVHVPWIIEAYVRGYF